MADWCVVNLSTSIANCYTVLLLLYMLPWCAAVDSFANVCHNTSARLVLSPFSHNTMPHFDSQLRLPPEADNEQKQEQMVIKERLCCCWWEAPKFSSALTIPAPRDLAKSSQLEGDSPVLTIVCPLVKLFYTFSADALSLLRLINAHTEYFQPCFFYDGCITLWGAGDEPI